MPQKKVWRVIEYKGTKDMPVGDYATKNEAEDRLRDLARRHSKNLPLCSPPDAQKLESCILDVKAKLPAKCEPHWSKPQNKQPEGCYNPFSVCRASLKCRLGESKGK